MREFKTTEEIEVPKKLIDQVIGQDRAADIIKKAAAQKRNVLLIGPPGTGKSMLAQAMAELMPREELEDVLVYPNPNNENQPLIRVVKTYPDYEYLTKNPTLIGYYTQKEMTLLKGAKKEDIPNILKVGLGRRVTNTKKTIDKTSSAGMPTNTLILMIGLVMISIVLLSPSLVNEDTKWMIVAVLGIFGLLYILSNATAGLGKRMGNFEEILPKLIVDNTEQKMAPFIDATGTKAGALLGDCKHDPLQCFFPNSTAFIVKDGKSSIFCIDEIVDGILAKYPNLIERNDDGYEGIVLPKEEEIYVMGNKNGNAQPVRILCVNRRARKGKMKVIKQNGSKLLITPEHKVYANGTYIQSKSLKGNEDLTTHSELILEKGDMIKTFSEQDQKDAYNYYKFLEIKNNNPEFGYKRIAKMLGIKAGQTRWWNNNTYKPKAVQTIERLEKFGLMPFKLENKSTPIIARILGTTFGDGGIFSTLNGIFLSSGEEESLNDYAQDLIAVFGEHIGKNFERRISGINNTGMCVWNTNRDVVRFFIALGAPIGRKNRNLKIPSWIYLSEETQKEFFGALLGNELCSPRFCPKQNKIQCLAVGLAGNYSLKQNRIDLLNEIAHYLNSYGVKTSPNINENEFREGSYCWRLWISVEIENLLRFYRMILIRYSNAKISRIQNAIEKSLERKKSKYDELIQIGKTQKYLNATLRASENTLQKISLGQELEFDESEIEFSGHVYNITTESGNLFANGILVSNSGGLGTPAHLRVESGAIQRANKGVLFIDEIASLKWNWQQELLTAMQEKKYTITGQSEMGSGALVKTRPVPTEFVLVAAGNLQDMKQIHPALRSRIRGAGYEVYVEDNMEDNKKNEDLLVQFVAQEIRKDKRIPNFTKEAVTEIIDHARGMSGRKKKLTLNLRDLGGLVRAAGDIAKQENLPIVDRKQVLEAKKVFMSIEGQLSKKMIEMKKEYQTVLTKGYEVGRVNGLAVLDQSAGLVLPIVAEMTPASSKSEGKVIATGKLGFIAKEAVNNVSAVIKKHIGTDISQQDMYIQFLQTYEGVEGDSASISIAVAVISAITEIPINQEYGMTGSLDIRGDVLPIGGVNAKISAAIEMGLKKVIIPESNMGDVLKQDKKIQIIPAKNIVDVLEHALKDTDAKKKMLAKMRKEF